MRFQDLSPEDQRLVKTNFGDDVEKIAAERVALANEMYQQGYDVIATAIVDQLNKTASEDEKKENPFAAKDKEEHEEKEEHEGKMDPESEKSASELGKLIARGTLDSLMEKGASEHGDQLHYLYPYLEQKVAAAGADSALKVFRNALGQAKNRVKAHGADAFAATRQGAQRAGDAVRGAVSRAGTGAKEVGRAVTGNTEHMVGKMDRGSRLALAASGAKKMAPVAGGVAAAGGAGYGASRYFGKKED
jgi:uncharacterized membrane-anchored protein YhcB (DUF1043 family)